jgi:hypothetical protein
MTTNNKIYIGLSISIIIVILNSFVLNNIPQFIEQGSEIGLIITNLCLAYISSYIFYLIVNVSREKEIKRTVSATINRSTEKILFHGFYIIDILSIDEKNDRKKNYDRRSSISESEYKELCRLVNPNSNSRFNSQIGDLEIKILTKIEALHSQCITMVKKHIEKTFLFLPYLEDEHIKILNEITDSQLYSLDRTLFFAKTNSDFRVYENFMFDYLKLILKLEKYYNKSIA